MESTDGHCSEEIALKAQFWQTVRISHPNIHIAGKANTDRLAEVTVKSLHTLVEEIHTI